MDASEQDKLFERLLARSLRQSLQPSGTECPDAEILAAYSDRTLSETETAHRELHFSTCARCQAVLAAIAAGALEPTDKEEEELAMMAAAAAMPAAAARATQAESAHDAASAVTKTHARPGWLDWRWLAPAAAAAAVGIIWLAVKPGSHPPAMPAIAVAPAQKPAERAQNTPPQPAHESTRQAAPAETRRKQNPSAAPKALALADKTRAAESKDAFAVGGAAPARRGDQAGKKDQGADESAAPRGESAKAIAAPPPPAAAAGGAGTAKAAPGMAAAGAAANTAQVEAAAAEKHRARAKKESAARAESAAVFPRPMAMRPAYVLVATPLRTALWRVGPGGSIEVSRDAGRTWQPQRTNVTADLTAVSAPSETVCWAVGSGGVVLRTTDGEHWEKIASPAARDWTHVEARDALHASVADSGAGYITADGGRSWRALP